VSLEFLRQVAATPLPKSFNDAKDVDAIKILRQAGLVIALVDEPHEGARVLAITEKGHAELLHFHYPDERARRTTGEGSWLHLAARRARKAFERMGAVGGRSS
jgi:hypothetical protein